MQASTATRPSAGTRHRLRSRLAPAASAPPSEMLSTPARPVILGILPPCWLVEGAALPRCPSVCDRASPTLQHLRLPAQHVWEAVETTGSAYVGGSATRTSQITLKTI